MKHKKYGIQILGAVLLSFLIMLMRGLFRAGTLADRVLIICDGFTITAFCFLGIGALIWVSTTGWFDIFGFAFGKALHAFIPGRVHDKAESYYDYKVKKAADRKPFSERSTLIIGFVLLLVSIVLTCVWYQL